MRRYPDMASAVPIKFLKPSRTSKILTPSIILTTVIVLAASSITGSVIAASIFSSSSHHTAGVSATQVLVLVASSLSVLYILLHFIAALKNAPIGMVRPPDVRVHAMCFIVARLALVAWMVAMVTFSVIISRPAACLSGTRHCRLQILDVVAASLGFVALGVVLTALESCQYPFQAPSIFHVPQMVTCRVSSFGDEILKCRVSRSSSFEDEHFNNAEKPKSISRHASINRKPVSTPPASTMREEYPERPLTPLLPMAQPSRQRGWGDEWTHIVKEPASKKKALPTLPKSDSGISLSRSLTSDTCSAYTSTSSESSNISVSKRNGRPRTVTPSSSIGNLSRRSPLSTMRSAEFPDIVVQSEIKFLPPTIPPPHEWNQSRTASLAQLLPIAEVRGLQRRPSAVSGPLVIRRPNKLSETDKGAPVRRNMTDVKVPGAYTNYRLSLNDERRLEDHAKKIEAHSMASVRSRSQKQRPKAPTRLPSGEAEKRNTSSSRVDSRSRYRETRPTIKRAHTVKDSLDLRSNPTRVHETKRAETIRVKPFRRLSLGDISHDLNWEV